MVDDIGKRAEREIGVVFLRFSDHSLEIRLEAMTIRSDGRRGPEQLFVVSSHAAIRLVQSVGGDADHLVKVIVAMHMGAADHLPRKELHLKLLDLFAVLTWADERDAWLVKTVQRETSITNRQIYERMTYEPARLSAAQA